jgi:hypothetical protein
LNVVYRRLLICLSVPICLFTLAQCGLEYLPYLTPPESLVPGSKSFGVRKVSENDDEELPNPDPPPDWIWKYLGIELYYKFYLYNTVPSSHRNFTSVEQLETNGFHRITSSDDVFVRKPVLEVNTEPHSPPDPPFEWPGDVEFTIDLSIAKMNIEEKSTSTVMVVQIRRGVRYESTEPGYPNYRPFLWDDLDAIPQEGFRASHADVDQELYDFISDPLNSGSPITMVMYALSYGKQDRLLIDLYSDAVYLGEIDIDFGW